MIKNSEIKINFDIDCKLNQSQGYNAENSVRVDFLPCQIPVPKNIDSQNINVDKCNRNIYFDPLIKSVDNSQSYETSL